jgi:hypothetical protein
VEIVLYSSPLNMVVASKALLGFLAGASFTFVDAFWRMNCGIIQTGRVDPIVNPGGISAHAHKISGPSSKSTHIPGGCTEY